MRPTWSRPPPASAFLRKRCSLFAESGYGGASMRELARRVGVRESSLYNHFTGKAAILEAIVSEYGPASSASRLEQPRYRQLSHQPAAFCRQFALDLVAQWSDPREHQFQKVITAERNRVPGIRAKFADQFYSREQRLMTDYFRGFTLAGLISTTGSARNRAAVVGRFDLHSPRTLCHGRAAVAACQGDGGHRSFSCFLLFLARRKKRQDP